MLLMALVSRSGIHREEKADQAPTPSERKQAVFLPPPAVLRQLVPLPRPKRPTPERPPDKGKDRISIGPPSSERAKGPLVLRREDDLTKAPKGRPDAVPPTPTPPAATAEVRGGAKEIPSRQGLQLPEGLGQVPEGREGVRGRPGPSGPSIASSLARMEQRYKDAGPRGLPSGTGQQVGPLFFDPQGADFTAWINHFKNEVYRNWIVPESVRLGYHRGHVDIEFTVERDGSLSEARIVKSSGTAVLDRAALNALQGSRFLPLPADFAPPRVTMQAIFFYNEAPQGS